MSSLRSALAAFFALRFKDKALEARFVATRMPQMLRLCQIAVLPSLLVPVLELLQAWNLDPQFRTRTPRIIHMVASILTHLLICLMAMANVMPRGLRTCLGTEDPLRFESIGSIFVLFNAFGVIFTKYRTSAILGESAWEVWQTEDTNEVFTPVMISYCCTCIPSIVPARFCVAWPVPVFLPLCFVLVSRVYGSSAPGGPGTQAHFAMLAIGVLGAIGAIRSERVARERFLAMDGTLAKLRLADELLARERQYRHGCMAIMKATHNIVFEVDVNGKILSGHEQLHGVILSPSGNFCAAALNEEEQRRYRNHLAVLRKATDDDRRLAQRLDLRVRGVNGPLDVRLCSVGLSAGLLLVGLNLEEEEVVAAVGPGAPVLDLPMPRPRLAFSSCASTAVTYKTSKSQKLQCGQTVDARVRVVAECGTTCVMKFQVATHCAEYVRRVKQECELWAWDALKVTTECEETTRVLGAGSFGKVTLATCRGIPVACKTWACSDFAAVRREIATLTLLSHKKHQNICHVLGVAMQPTFRVFLELCAGSLAQWLAVEQPHEGQQWSILNQVCSALSHLHAHSIVHMDLKSDNILVVEHASPGQLPWVKVADVGLSQWRSQRAGEQTTKVASAWTALRPWRAPEMAVGISTTAVDMFSFAGLFVELARGSRMSFADVALHQALSAVGPELVSTWVHRLLDVIPEMRPTAPEIAAWLTVECAVVMRSYTQWLRENSK